MSEETSQDRIQELRTMDYEIYLRTPEWQQRREQALARALHRCQVCYKDKDLNVHHRTYLRRGSELPEDLTVLCKSCHSLHHAVERLEYPMLSGEIVPTILERVSEGIEKQTNVSLCGIPTGYRILDHLLGGFEKDRLYILAGIPMVGKTTFALNIAFKAARKEKRCLFISLEQSKEQVTQRLISLVSWLDTFHLKQSSLDDEGWERLLIGLDSISRYPLWIADPADIATTEIQAYLAQFVEDGVCMLDLVVIDGLGLLRAYPKTVIQ